VHSTPAHIEHEAAHHFLLISSDKAKHGRPVGCMRHAFV